MTETETWKATVTLWRTSTESHLQCEIHLQCEQLCLFRPLSIYSMIFHNGTTQMIFRRCDWIASFNTSVGYTRKKALNIQNDSSPSGRRSDWIPTTTESPSETLRIVFDHIRRDFSCLLLGAICQSHIIASKLLEKSLEYLLQSARVPACFFLGWRSTQTAQIVLVASEISCPKNNAH